MQLKDFDTQKKQNVDQKNRENTKVWGRSMTTWTKF